MKLKNVLSLLLAAVTIHAAELSNEAVRKAYYSSYELETQERYAEASKALDPVIKSYPQGYTVNYRRGWLAYLNGNYADARKYYQIALTQYPISLEIRKALILLEVARKEWKEVEQQARTGRQTDYYNLDFAYWQAVALRAQGQLDNAIKVAEEISILYPTNTNFLNELARCRFLKEEKEAAAALLESIFILDPHNQEAATLSRKLK